ncbi:MAG TPA: tetratricopeptide repeat protein [Rhodanobacteraceae bacterium]|nr:tetratricopeptide repeat protein [Rhodanobacteraceae bacterium]
MIEPTSTQRQLFEGALALPPAQRHAWLAAQCADAEQRAFVMRMLASDAADSGGALDQPIDNLLDRVGECDAELPMPSDYIGPFRLHEKLGEGGSSIVFRATRAQAGVDQVVALKLLRRGLHGTDEQRRFRDERRALAQLRHPGIARLIEGGITDAGIPYIALELVDGEPITAHACAHRLDLRQRLRLFVAICRAVEAAHRALIVHRDLKPSNVLVTPDGDIKLLDFGIAKLLDTDALDSTHTQDVPMTPAYAAPEQFTHGQITTATDVYALGVLLDELVTGVRREHGDARTPSSRISEDAAPGVLPATPKISRRALRGDLDNIVLKAIAPEPERRYASAGAFAEDIARHLDGLPVAAHPPSRWYRARKFVRRHRGGVASTVAFLLAILAALGLALWQADVARDETLRAASVRDFLLRVFSAAEPAGPRLAPPSVVDVVRAAITDARRSSSLHPAVRVELLDTLGGVLGAQGDLEGSVKLLTANYADASSRLGASQPDTLLAGIALSSALAGAGQRAEARKLLDTLLPAGEQVADPDVSARLLATSARLGVDRFEQQRSEDESARALALCKSGCSGPTRVMVLLTRGGVLAGFQHDAAAIAVFEQALALQRTLYDGPHVAIADTLQSLSRAHRRLGHLERAEALARESLAIVEASVPDPHVRRTDALDTLRQVLIDSNKLDEAIVLGQRIIAMDRATLGPQHPDLATSENTLGFTYAHARQYANAIQHYRAALAISESIPDNARRSAIYRSNLGDAVGRSGDPKSGSTLIQTSIDALGGMHDPDYGEICSALEKLGNIQRTAGQLDAALATYLRSDRLYREKLPDAPKEWHAVTLVGLGRTYMDRHDDAQAASALQEALTSETTPPDTFSSTRVTARAALAGVLHRRGDDAAARTLLQQAEHEAQAAQGSLAPDQRTFIDDVSASITAH